MNPADRIRLRRNPKNVATPQGFDDLYFDGEGNLIHETSSGEKETVGGSTVNGISDVPGLQTALDEKLESADIASGTITPKTGDLDFNSLGAPTNAQINTAIGTDPIATSLALGSATAQDFGGIASSFLSQRKDMTAVYFGDSLMNTPRGVDFGTVVPEAGGWCPASQALTVSGGATIESDWAYPGGRNVTLPSGAIAQWGRYNVTAAASAFFRGSVVEVHYIRGTGTLRLQSASGTSSSFADISGQTAIDTSTGGAAGTVAVRTFTMTGGQAANFYRFRTISDSGTIKVLGVGIKENTGGNRDSFRAVHLNLGGSFESEWVQVTQTNWTAVLTALAPQMFIFKAWEGHVTSPFTDTTTTLDRIRTALPAGSKLILVATHPTTDNPLNTGDSEGWQTFLRNYAATNSSSTIFLDTRRYWPNYTAPNAIYADGTHLTELGVRYERQITAAMLQTINATKTFMPDINSPVRYWFSGVDGFVNPNYGVGPGATFAGDLYNANGGITFASTVGATGSYSSGPSIIAFANQAQIRVAGGFALGLSPTDHKIVFSSRNSGRAWMANWSNAETFMTRDPSGRLEITSNGTSEPSLTLSVPTGQTADILEFRTAASGSAAGTLAGGINANAIYYHTPVAHTATTAAIPVTSQNTALTTTAGAQAITLADGIPGQTKTITHVVDGGSAVLTPTTKTGYTTITFTDVGDTVTLKFWATYGWMIESIRGAVAA